jgi:hypothetical protein
MSALGHKQTSRLILPMSALPPKADIRTRSRNVRYVPITDIAASRVLLCVLSVMQVRCRPRPKIAVMVPPPVTPALRQINVGEQASAVKRCRKTRRPLRQVTTILVQSSPVVTCFPLGRCDCIHGAKPLGYWSSRAGSNRNHPLVSIGFSTAPPLSAQSLNALMLYTLV